MGWMHLNAAVLKPALEDGDEEVRRVVRFYLKNKLQRGRP